MRQNQTITSKNSELYETDFYAWTIEQAQYKIPRAKLPTTHQGA